MPLSASDIELAKVGEIFDGEHGLVDLDIQGEDKLLCLYLRVIAAAKGGREFIHLPAYRRHRRHRHCCCLLVNLQCASC